MDILSNLKASRLYFDGGYGTSLQSHGLKPGELPELWNLSHSDIITALHKAYFDAGCNIATTNTFGANPLKFDLQELDEIISAAVSCAETARKTSVNTSDKYIALDLGPTGKLLKPLGDLDFEDAVEVFAQTVRLGVKYGVDLIIIETMNDSYETKAALLAAKENSDLPVFVTNAYDESGKLMTGASPEAMVALLEGLGADAIGVNCSLGPDKLIPVIKKILEYSSLPVIVNPNAGLPIFKDGRTSYALTPGDFAETMAEIAEMGASVLGGCCGTTPEHIRRLVLKTQNIPLKPAKKKNFTVISSYTHAVYFDKRPVLIGERINPTGKPRFKTALREENYDYILKEGVAQQEAGADVLDVNVGLPEIDEKSVLTKTVQLLQSVSALPLQLDTSDPSAMESALRIYNGKPLINSVNGKPEVMDAVFPLAAKYGGVVIALTIDESGIPETADGRINTALKIISRAAEYGIPSNDIIVDPLAMTISSDNKSALVTLECLKRLSDMGIKTSLGVSNVSFGLPQRGLINSTFFTMALNNGLGAAIMNPHASGMMDAYYSYCALAALDSNCEKYIEYSAAAQEQTTAPIKTAELSPEEALKRAVLKGLKENAADAARTLLTDTPPLDIIDKSIIPALDEMGVKFEKKTAFLPQLLMSAEAAKAAFDIIKENLSAGGKEREKKYKIVIATVKGDIHDIGKNIVKVLLENYDFDVIDLGKDVPPELIAETAVRENVPLVGLSALMTTTVPAMEDTVKLLRKVHPACRVVVGGAVLTQEYADMIGADKYAKDAMETVRYAESLI